MPLTERDEPMQPATALTDEVARTRWMRHVLERALSRMLPAELAPAREDLIQTALLRILERSRGEQEPIRTASYLWRVAFSVSADELRRRRRSGEESMDQTDLELQEAAHAADAPPVGFADALRDCIGRLATARRGAVVLHLQGFAATDAARVLRTGEKRVQNLTYRGLADLRDCLSRKGLSR